MFPPSLPRPSRLLAVALGLASLGTAAQAQSCHPVEIRNVRPGQGTVMVSAYTDAADFNLRRAAAAEVRAGAADSLTLQVCGLNGAASVALMVTQDLNGNGKLDRNLLGLPTEPWGASANPSAMAAPRWDTTQVPLTGNTIVVKLSQ